MTANRADASMLAQTSPALESVRARVFEAHGGDPNFTGCAIGFRRRGGEVTDEPAVIAMVVRKRPEGVVSSYRMLPKAIEAGGQRLGVDVVEAGPLGFAGLYPGAPAASAESGPITGLIRPPVQGASISNFNSGETGTLGCFVIDNADGKVCVLSSCHALAKDGMAGPSDLIVQPAVPDGGAEVDGIAFLKRFIPFGTGTNTVDAAIAQLTDQAHYGTGVAGNLMAGISPSHPAVGMSVADDASDGGTNCFLGRMDNTLSQLNVKLVGATSSSTAVVAPVVGMHIEKVGRTSGYTSTVVDAIGAKVKVQYSGGIVTMSDMIWTQAMSLPGDSGAVVCQGGDGHTFAPTPTGGGVSCALTDAVSTYYKVPLNSQANLTLADNLRDRFLAMSNTGQLLIGVTYLNAQAAVDRMQSRTGTAHNQSVAQARAQSLYSHYHDLAAKLAGSSSPNAVVTAADVSTVSSILFGLAAPVSVGGTAMLTPAESQAAWILVSDVIKPALGMNRQQLISYMNESTVFQQVYNQLAAVSTIKVIGAGSPG